MMATLALTACDGGRGDLPDAGEDGGDGGLGAGEQLVVRVVDVEWRLPVAGAVVKLGDGQQATTDASGEVRLSQVQVPFSLHVSYEHEPSRFEPGRLETMRLIEQRERSLEVGIQGPAREMIDVILDGEVRGSSGLFSSTYVTAFGGQTELFQMPVDPSTGAFQLPLRWVEGVPLELTLLAYEPDPLVSSGVRLLGAATAKLTIDDIGGALPHPVLTLGAVQGASLAGTVTVAPSATAYAVVSLSHLGRAHFLSPELIDVSGGAFSMPFPALDGMRAQIQILHFRDGGAGLDEQAELMYRQVTPPQNELAFVPPPPVELLAPADGAALSAATVFRWSSQAQGGKHLLSLICSDDALEPRSVWARLETTSLEIAVSSIPELAALDLSTTICDWRIVWLDERSATDIARGVIGEAFQLAASPFRELMPADFVRRDQACDGAASSATMKRLPSPSLLSTWISPPSAWTCDFTMARPRPLPPLSRLRPASRR